MQHPDKLRFRTPSIVILLASLFVINACAPQPTPALENSDTHTYVYVICGDTNLSGGCEDSDTFISGVPVTIFHKDSTQTTTFTNENGSVTQFFPNDAAVNIDLAAAEQQTGLCRTNRRELVINNNTTLVELTLTLCGTSSS